MATPHRCPDPYGSGSIQIRATAEELYAELRKTRLEVKILQLFSAQLITSSEFRHLTKMCHSEDLENLTVAEETVNNLMKKL